MNVHGTGSVDAFFFPQDLVRIVVCRAFSVDISCLSILETV